jgi:uncharacterized protein YbjT (DUF2867 family)
MIVVTTPTGKIASQLIPLLLDAKEQVRVIVREPQKLSPTLREHVEVFQGSSDDEGVLDRALDGADTLFWVVPPAFNTNLDAKYFVEFTRPVSRVIERRRVPRVVSVSSLGRGHELARDAGPIAATHAKDALLEATGAAYRALWCPGFMENMFGQLAGLRRGVFGTSGRGDLAIPHVATRDIAAAAAKLLLDRAWSGTGGVAVLGPEDLSHDETAAVLSDVLARPIRYQQLSGEDYASMFIQHGATEALARGIVRMYDAIDHGLYNVERRTVENTTPTSFRKWASEVLKPALST